MWPSTSVAILVFASSLASMTASEGGEVVAGAVVVLRGLTVVTLLGLDVAGRVPEMTVDLVVLRLVDVVLLTAALSVLVEMVG